MMAEMHSLFEALKAKGIVPGSVVMSRRGHDAGKVYLVLRRQEQFLELCDGQKRPIEKPKKKRLKHVQSIGTYQQWSLQEREFFTLPPYEQNRRITLFINEVKESCRCYESKEENYG